MQSRVQSEYVNLEAKILFIKTVLGMLLHCVKVYSVNVCVHVHFYQLLPKLMSINPHTIG